MRVNSAKRTKNGGWLHFLIDGRDNHRSPAAPPPSPAKLQRPSHDWPALASEFHNAGERHLPALARLLNLPAATLHAFGVGCTTRARLNLHGTYLKAEAGAWTMPMRDGSARIVGIILRGDDGTKLTMKGARTGLFIPAALLGIKPLQCGPLVIAEGFSDTAALASLGLNAVGRSSCRSDVEALCEYAARRQVDRALILADRDGPGYDGATALAKRLCVHVARVRLDVPPDGYKDARAWVAGGASRADVVSLLTRRPQQVETALHAEGGAA